MRTCRICGGDIAETYSVKEMMLGLREPFDYNLCGDCGCLQISEIPADMSIYYPGDYYSFLGNKKKKTRLLRDFIRKSRHRFNICGIGLIGRVLSLFKASNPLHDVYRRIGLKLSDSILDVGGGGGAHVLALHSIGFSNAMAVDPNIEQDVVIDDVLIAKKSEIYDIQGHYDVVVLHHSLEHMSGQVEIMKKAAELIGENGRLLVRVPTVTSTAWETYKENWVNLDAPRHFYLHSHDSIRNLADQAGLKILDFWNDSVGMQFWGSEQYAQDIHMKAAHSHTENEDASIFNEAQIQDYQRQAAALNEQGKGDWICVLLGN